MVRVALEDLLRDSMGLNVASIGAAAIARAVQERLSACDLDDPRVYLERVRQSGAELQALIEAVVVSETWFFRDREALIAVARRAVQEWLPVHPTGVLALLSVPCSTGEEPYSIAMALIEAGVPPNRFHVDAVDISRRNLAQGERAVYGKNSFRGQDVAFRGRHFTPTADGYRVSEAVRQQVRFQQGNLLAPEFLPGTAIYDAIVCRNVLIYFDRPTQARALGVLSRLLRDDGVLYVGAAESGMPAGQGLRSTREPQAFAFRKSSRSVPIPKRAVATPAAPTVLRHRAAAPASAALAGVLSPPPATPAGGIDEAIALADHGHFVEAAHCCEEHLRLAGPSAPAYYLMGLVRDATGNHVEASAYYRKALYLDPTHYETQIQLALLLQKQGDLSGAQVMRNRSRRLELKSRSGHE